MSRFNRNKGINHDGPIAVVIIVLRHTRHFFQCRCYRHAVVIFVGLQAISAARGTEKCSMIIAIFQAAASAEELRRTLPGSLVFAALPGGSLRGGQTASLWRSFAPGPRPSIPVGPAGTVVNSVLVLLNFFSPFLDRFSANGCEGSRVEPSKRQTLLRSQKSA